MRIHQLTPWLLSWMTRLMNLQPVPVLTFSPPQGRLTFRYEGSGGTGAAGRGSETVISRSRIST